jgi:hypothetical protein
MKNGGAVMEISMVVSQKIKKRSRNSTPGSVPRPQNLKECFEAYLCLAALFTRAESWK